MKFSVCLTTAALLVAASALFTADSANFGTAVSDNVAAELHGGCAGLTAAPTCIFCSGTVYINGSHLVNREPGSITGYYCIQNVNGEETCRTCSSTYVSCTTKVD